MDFILSFGPNKDDAQFKVRLLQGLKMNMEIRLLLIISFGDHEMGAAQRKVKTSVRGSQNEGGGFICIKIETWLRSNITRHISMHTSQSPLLSLDRLPRPGCTTARVLSQ